MTPKLFKATDVCELAQLQPYVLRSWEKEFPGIGVQKADGQRLYRQSDVDQVLRIKQLVFSEGLTLSGARRRIEETQPVAETPGARSCQALARLRLATGAGLPREAEALAAWRGSPRRAATVRAGFSATGTGEGGGSS
jgi:DNA-binding transcriptional MerR regulator